VKGLKRGEIKEIAEYLTEKLREQIRTDLKHSIFYDEIELQIGMFIGEIGGEDEEYLKRLKEINMNVKNVRGKISTEGFTVYFSPAYCHGDHCIAGLRVVIDIKKPDVFSERDAEFIVNLIKTLKML